jgi:hypothetical protein
MSPARRHRKSVGCTNLCDDTCGHAQTPMVQKRSLPRSRLVTGGPRWYWRAGSEDCCLCRTGGHTARVAAHNVWGSNPSLSRQPTAIVARSPTNHPVFQRVQVTRTNLAAGTTCGPKPKCKNPSRTSPGGVLYLPILSRKTYPAEPPSQRVFTTP